ncbi:MAG: FAD-binding oxidoreductase [Candidatus Acidiferrum sp.]
MKHSFRNRWGKSPWRWAVQRGDEKVPARADFVVIGGGFSGLSAATWLGRMARGKKVVLLEAEKIGAGASGRTGGMTLAETAGGDLPALGDVLGGFTDILRELGIACDFLSHGAWEIGRKKGLRGSEISWRDSGRLRVMRQVPGGTVDAGKLLGGLARAALAARVTILEKRAVTGLKAGKAIRVVTAEQEILAGSVLIATNAQSLELGGLQDLAVPKLTMAVATEPLSEQVVKRIGMASRRPFYTVDFPYLWGRLTQNNRAIFGSGLLSVRDWEELHTLDVSEGHGAAVLESVKTRVRGLHPALREVKFTHAWGGPILFTDKMRPIFRHIARRSARTGRQVIYLGGYNGHGVALSVYLGRWAAEALLGKRKLPDWQ